MIRWRWRGRKAPSRETATRCEGDAGCTRTFSFVVVGLSEPRSTLRPSPNHPGSRHAMLRLLRRIRRAQDRRRAMANTNRDIGIAAQIGTYGDAVEAPANARWLITAGTPGLAADGTLPPDITGQAEIAWANVLAMLERAGMTIHDVVKVT